MQETLLQQILQHCGNPANLHGIAPSLTSTTRHVGGLIHNVKERCQYCPATEQMVRPGLKSRVLNNCSIRSVNGRQNNDLASRFHGVREWQLRAEGSCTHNQSGVAVSHQQTATVGKAVDLWGAPA